MEPSKKRQRYSISIPFPPSLNGWNSEKLDDSSIYPTVLLHLGFVLSRREEEKELLALLCHNWSLLADKNIFDFHTEIELATQVLFKSDDISAIRSVFKILSVLLSSFINQYGKKDDELFDDFRGKLSSAVMQHIDREEGIVAILQKLATISPSDRELYTAACVIWKKTDDNIMDRELFLYGKNIEKGLTNQSSITLPLDNKGVDCQLKFLWALSHARQISTVISETVTIMDFLFERKQYQTLSIIANQNRPTTKIALLLQKLFTLINWDGDDRVVSSDCKKQELKALLRCAKLFETSYEFFDKVEMIAFDEDASLAKIATEILCEIYDHRGLSSILRRLQNILEKSNVMEILERVVGSLSKNKEVYTKQLISSVADVARRDSATSYLRQKAITIFHYYVEKNPSHWVGIARDPKVVKAVIKALASDSRHIIHDQSLEILWKISTPVANRRVLAHHIGLLPCLVRVLRRMPVEQEDGDEIRARWKERVMTLAEML